MNSVEAISWFENRMKNTTMPGARAMFSMALSALRAQQERENPKPLTPDELKEMDGEPVWIIPLCVDIGWTAQWRIYTVREPVTVNAKSYGWYGLHLKDYGKTWVAYRHKPKEVQE